MRNFRIQVSIRVVLIALNMLAAVIFVVKYQLIASSLVASALVVVQVVWLIGYVEQTNHTLNRFFSAIRYDDFMTSSYPKGRGKTFEKLQASLAAVTRQFRKVRAEKEASYRYLERVIHHIDTAMISFDKGGMVSFLNPAARRLFQLPGLHRLEGLAELDPRLVSEISSMKNGEKRVLNLNRSGERLELAISMTEFKLEADAYRLVSFIDIQNELERKEVDAWQKLIRVLTHEIMNSVTPISTLADTLQQMIFDRQNGTALLRELDVEASTDASQGLEIIRRRSQGLLHFVESYRNLTRIPPPEYEWLEIDALFHDLARLFRKQVENDEIDFFYECQPPDLKVYADPQLLEQVLINLILNAIEALRDQKEKEIRLGAIALASGGVEIRVSDNGAGIPPENMEQIFIPFYSSKEGGMGVGLSISRQIIQAHGGVIRARSTPGVGTQFVLSL